MDRFKNIYRIDSSRLKNWDYGKNASYFITICIKNRQNLFGEIINDEMNLNELGKIAEEFWKIIPINYDFTKISNFVVMPNHIHGILIIDKNEKQILEDVDIRKYFLNFDKGGFAKHKNPMLNNNVSKVIKWYKGRVTFEIRKQFEEFEWQERYWDNIIKNDEEFLRILKYIENNPKNWKDDQFYL